MAGLPMELVFDILSRLPVKDLLRMRSVCKTWRALIADPRFVKRQFDRSIEGDKLNIIFADNKNVYYVSDVSNKAAINDPTKLELPLKESPFIHLQETLVGSCNGLLCFYDKSSNGIFVLNPFTRELKNLPELPAKHRGSLSFLVWGFGFCSDSQHFKVVRILYFIPKSGSASVLLFEPRAIVHTVGSDSWRSITTIQSPTLIGNRKGQILVNGAPHWEAEIPDGSSSKIVYFDVAREVFGELPYPPDNNINDNTMEKTDCLGELRGRLCVLRGFHGGGEHVEIWVMDEYCIKESWNMKFSISHPIVFDDRRRWNCELLWFLQNGEILVTCGGRVAVYDPSRESIRMLNIPECGGSVEFHTRDIDWDIRRVFVESLHTF